MPDTATAAASAKHTTQQDAELAQQRADHAERGIRAWLLAPTIDIYLALMRGEDVPIDRLNPEAVKRYGLRRVT